MGYIRTCTADDIPAVARMFHKAFRGAAAAAPPSLESYLRELFLEHPWRDTELTSRVYVDPEGRVGGFIGVLPMRMSFRGRPVRAALASSLVVDDPARYPMAGPRLMRSYLTGPQELCVSETSNPVAQRMWEAAGGRSVADYSMEWLRLLRPVGLGVALIEERISAARFLRPLAALTDRLIARFAPKSAWPAPIPPPIYSGVDVDDEVLIEQIPRFAELYGLHPDWDRDALEFFLRHAARKGRYGDFYRRMVYRRNKEPVGCYLYYGRRGKIAFALQILSRPEAVDAVVADLLAHAEKLGCVAVRGRTQPRLLCTLLRQHCFFFHRSMATVFTADADLLGAVSSGDAFIVGLAGESWTRLIGEQFE